MITKEHDGALEITGPDEAANLRMEAIAAVGRACEGLAEALKSPLQVVTINCGPITANAQNAVSISNKKKRKPRSA